MEAWWQELGSPSLTPELVALLVTGVDEELAGTDEAELVRQRDELLTDLLLAKAARSALP
jgi:hypothetical protein